MITSNARDTYERLLQAMQQRALQDRGGMPSAPDAVSGFDDGAYRLPQGGLLGRLIALQTGQGKSPTGSPVSRPTLFEARDPNFRQLSRVVNRTHDAIGTSQEHPSEVRRGQSTMSDAPPESISAGAQYAQGPGALSFEAPGGRALDGNPLHDPPIQLYSPDVGQDALGAILGAALVAIIHESKKRQWPPKDIEGDSSGNKNKQKVRTDAVVRDMMGKALTSTSGADPGDPCDVRFEKEVQRCFENYPSYVANRLCKPHAEVRRNLCKEHGEKYDLSKWPEWSPEQEE